MHDARPARAMVSRSSTVISSMRRGFSASRGSAERMPSTSVMIVTSSGIEEDRPARPRCPDPPRRASLDPRACCGKEARDDGHAAAPQDRQDPRAKQPATRPCTSSDALRWIFCACKSAHRGLSTSGQVSATDGTKGTASIDSERSAAVKRKVLFPAPPRDTSTADRRDARSRCRPSSKGGWCRCPARSPPRQADRRS